MFKLTTTLLVLLCAFSNVFSQSNYEKALQYYRTNNIDSSIYYFNLTIKNTSDSTAEYFYAYIYKAILQKRLGNYNKGIEILLEAKNLNSSNVSDKQKYIYVNSNLANIYKYIGKYNEAIHLIQNVIDSLENNKIQLARNYNNLGNMYYETDQFTYAIHYYLKSLKLKKNNQQNVATTYHNIGNCYRELSKADSALINYTYALEHYSSDQSSNKVDLYLDLNKLYNDSTKLYLKKAIELGEKEDLSDIVLAKCHSNFGYHYLKNGKYKEALISFQKSLTLHLSDFNSTDFYNNQNVPDDKITLDIISLLEKKSIAFYKYSIQFPDPEKGLKFSLETANIGINLIDKLKVELLSWKDKQYLSHSKHRIFLNALHSAYDLSLVTSDKSYEEEFFYISEKAKAGSVRKEILDLQTIMNLLMANDQIVSYIVGDSTIFLYKITKNKSDVFSLKYDSEFQSFLSKYHSSLTSREFENNLSRNKANFKESAYTLYKNLVRDFIEPGVKNLYVIPDKQLLQLPFESFIIDTAYDSFKDFSYLIKHYNISYSSSISLLFENDKSAVGKVYSFVPKYELLPNIEHAKEEAELISEHIFLDSIATRSNFIQLLNQEKSLHFAGHSHIDSLNFENSGLIFSDSLLTISDIYNMPVSASRIILLSCQTSSGNIIKGEGLNSISYAFQNSGVKNIISSLWAIDDLATKNILSYYSKKNNLRKAKIAYIENAKTDRNHPYFWAGIVETKPYEATNYAYLILVGITLALLVSTIVLLKKKTS